MLHCSPSGDATLRMDAGGAAAYISMERWIRRHQPADSVTAELGSGLARDANYGSGMDNARQIFRAS